MENLEIMTALARSNILEYDSTQRGIKGTVYIDYANKIGYVWSDTSNSYIIVFNGNMTQGLNYIGTYNAITNVPDIRNTNKVSGDFWIVSVASGNYVIGDWLVWNGESFQTIRKDNNISFININQNTTITFFNSIYLVDSTSGDISISVGSAISGDNVRIIKSSSDTNKIVIDNKYVLINKEESVELIYDGFEWIMYDSNIQSYAVDCVKFKGVGDDVSWRIIPSGNDLLFQRYLNSEPHNVATLGNEFITNKLTLKNTGGRVSYKNVYGKTRTMIMPSKDTNGVCVGNPNGMVTLVNNGEAYSVAFDSTEKSNIVNSSISESSVGNQFSYRFKSNHIQAIKSAIIHLSNVSENTRLRFVVSDLDGNVLEENVSRIDFSNGGTSVSNGYNTITLKQELTLSIEYDFIVTMYFSQSVSISGSTINLNDGLGSRFIPTFNIKYLDGVMSQIATNLNIKELIQSLESANRIESNVVQNKVFFTDISINVGKIHINSTIYFNHTSGTCVCTPTDLDFSIGDIIRICAKSNVVFGAHKINKDDFAEFQKTASNTWVRLNPKHKQNVVYYVAQESDDITTQSIADCNYIESFQIGDNALSIQVSSIGNKYIYIIMAHGFMLGNSGYDVLKYVVIDGTKYTVFRTTEPIEFLELNKNIVVDIQ